MNVFKYVYNFIKSLFKKKDSVKVDVILEEQIVDSYSKLFSEIEVGDIVWGKRYFKERDKFKILKGHREGPFIVVYKYEDKLICVQGTSVLSEELFNDGFYLNNSGYNLHKETCFYLDNFKVLDDFSLIRKLDSLKEKDRNDLFKKLKIKGKNYFNIDNKYFNFRLPLQCGDIVCYNNKNYIIMDILDDKLFVVPFNNVRVTGKLKFQMFEFLDYSKIELLDNDEEIEFVNLIDDKMLLYILKKYKEYVDNCKNKNVTQRGSVLFKNNKYYYVYGEEGQYWLAFEFFKKYNSSLERIKIKDTMVYTKFNDIKINKKDDFDTVMLCIEEEIDNIKKIRKSYKKKCEEERNNNMQSKTYNLKNIRVRDTVKSIKYPNMEFVVVDIVGNMVGCVSYSEMGVYRPQKIYFNKKELKVVERVKKKQKKR